MHSRLSALPILLATTFACCCAPAVAQQKNGVGDSAIAAVPPRPSGLDLIDQLARDGQKREALAEADRLIAGGTASASLRARRGFLRRELNDLPGSAEDFAAALAGEGLTAEQRRNVEAGLTEAKQAEITNNFRRAQADLAKGAFDRAAAEAQAALESDPSSEPAMLIRLDALIRADRKQVALAEADQFVQRAPANALLRAQRGFLRRELSDAQGAADDFTAALSTDGLSADQRRNVEASLAEAQATVRQAGEAETREHAQAPPPAAPRGGSPADVDSLIARGDAPGWAYVQRGYARRKAKNLNGAIADFDAALKRGDIDKRARADVHYARAEAIAALAERNGRPLLAEATYRELLRSQPRQADGWYKLGYLLMKQKRKTDGANALARGLEVRPVATAYLDAANAYILSNAPLAAKEYRQGLDRWYAGDPSTARKTPTDLERIKNEVVQADASVQTNAAIGGITGRPASAGGNNTAAGADTRVRFDGRYLPALPGLEAFGHGLTDKDANGVRETDLGAGLRYRPIPDLNFYVGGMLDHFFQPKNETEFIPVWGLGLGSDAYPYAEEWKPYWDFGTFGSWRTSDQRWLEDVRGNVGPLYELRGPIRAAVGPTLLAVAGYDSKAGTPWAAGVGPTILAYVWTGGDKYRSYDTVVTVQVGYIFGVGPDRRQSGWRGQIGVTF